VHKITEEEIIQLEKKFKPVEIISERHIVRHFSPDYDLFCEVAGRARNIMKSLGLTGRIPLAQIYEAYAAKIEKMAKNCSDEEMVNKLRGAAQYLNYDAHLERVEEESERRAEEYMRRKEECSDWERRRRMRIEVQGESWDDDSHDF